VVANCSPKVLSALFIQDVIAMIIFLVQDLNQIVLVELKEVGPDSIQLEINSSKLTWT
jgi:hypothetical protein